MVRSTIAFAVVAFGAAAVIAQAPDFSELEARDYEIVESRGYEDVVEVARDFEDEALEARQLAGGQNPMPMNSYPSYPSNNSPVLAAAGPTPTPVGVDHAAVPASTPTSIPAGGEHPSQTVTVTHTPTPTSCTKKQAKREKQMEKIEEAVAIVRAADAYEGSLTSEQKKEVKKAKKFLKKVRHRKVKKAKRTIKKCKAALKKAKLTVKKCKAGADCESAYLAQDLSPSHCKAAFKYMKRVKAAKKAEKKSKHNHHKGEKKGKKDEHESHPADSHKADSHKADSHKADSQSTDSDHHKGKKSKSKAKLYSDLLPPTKTTKVGPDGITTVLINAGPTCTASPDSESKSSKSSKRLVARDVDFEYVYARDYDLDNLD
jgi:hypothetical protein